jgi:Ca2+-binding RTX toxin-like protein
MNSCRRWAYVAVSVVLVTLGHAGVGSAGTASFVTGLRYEAAPGETNRVYILEAVLEGFRIIDTTAPVTVGAGCTSVSVNEAFCPSQDYIHTFGVLVSTGDMDDFIKVSLGPEDPYEELVPGYDLARLRGGEGNDELEGGSASNVLDGGPGADTFHPSGSSGDLVDYSSRTNPVAVTLGDDIANDGEVGEGDLILSGIGAVRGGQGADNMSLTRVRRNPYGFFEPVLSGRGGDDVITSSIPRAVLVGDDGNDRLRAYDSLLKGGAGADALISGGLGLLRGGAGADRLFGRSRSSITGPDRMFGDEGPDTFFARDSRRDRADGGPGHDRARVDRFDTIISIAQLF